MKILTNRLSFYELIERQHLRLPTSLCDARKVQKASCKPSSFWGEFDFTDSDERKLRKHLESLYDGRINTPFVSNFALRFLRIAQTNSTLEE
ncbi:hypothetical protein [Caproiciproducens sp. CPB-2]|uniref:hypothetical protein n=1 Tax=Caproiciproducens sp. CPB-2 TaxID=3030017 RepID=UPI0023DA3A86|nr:hypothetical protein [Caproiciproducens sp. CPB-2]MDF1494977.1 hypothetical protein [Caproiciproducens sp. CPB-2]